MTESIPGTVNILVVEDDAVSRNVVSRLLERLGAGAVLTADNGAAALALLETTGTKVHLAICDIEMPEMTGYEFVRRLRYGTIPGYKDLPVLMLTGHGTDRNVRRAQTHRIDGFLVKPPQLDTLREAILDALAGG